MAIPEVDKSLTKALREIPEKGKSENGLAKKGRSGHGGASENNPIPGEKRL